MRVRLAWALLTCLGACGHGSVAPPVPPAPPPTPPPRVAPLPGTTLVLVPTDTDVASVDSAVPIVAVEVVATHEARQRGLGGRSTLPDGTGMLFVYADSKGRTFWMKECLIALDIAFLDDDGRIRAVATLPPGVGLSGQDIPSATCDEPIRYVLEVRARWMAEQGVAVDDVVDVSRVVVGVKPE